MFMYEVLIIEIMDVEHMQNFDPLKMTCWSRNICRGN
jgi:hypothetical protein